MVWHYSRHTSSKQSSGTLATFVTLHPVLIPKLAKKQNHLGKIRSSNKTQNENPFLSYGLPTKKWEIIINRSIFILTLWKCLMWKNVIINVSILLCLRSHYNQPLFATELAAQTCCIWEGNVLGSFNIISLLVIQKLL